MNTIVARDHIPGPNEDVILSTRQAASLCRCTEDRMRILAGDGRVPATFVRNQWHFSRDDLMDLLDHHPEVIYARRTPQVVVTASLRASRRATMLRLKAVQDRHEIARLGFGGLRRKLALKAGFDPENLSEENQRSIDLLCRAHMTELAAKRTSGRKAQTTPERIAILTNDREQNGDQVSAICYDCWRERWGRPPFTVPNAPCERHQRDYEEFAARLREAS